MDAEPGEVGGASLPGPLEGKEAWILKVVGAGQARACFPYRGWQTGTQNLQC